MSQTIAMLPEQTKGGDRAQCTCTVAAPGLTLMTASRNVNAQTSGLQGVKKDGMLLLNEFGSCLLGWRGPQYARLRLPEIRGISMFNKVP